MFLTRLRIFRKTRESLSKCNYDEPCSRGDTAPLGFITLTTSINMMYYGI
jgi:hypothetical protein